MVATNLKLTPSMINKYLPNGEINAKCLQLQRSNDFKRYAKFTIIETMKKKQH